MLWKNLIRALCRYAQAHPEDPGVQTLAVAHHPDGWGVWLTHHFDIRQVGWLRDVCPRAFPRPLRSGPLVAQKNIRNQWKVEVVENS